MRCHEARRRLLKSRGIPSENEMDLIEHLRTCRKCHLFARAEKALRLDLGAAAVDDNVDTLSPAALRTRVEAAADNPKREINLMLKIKGQLKSRPRVGVITAITVIVLALVTLVPFKTQETVAYEVAIAGVDRNLAVDEQKVDQLLTALDLEDARFDVEGCEATCVVKISELESEEDVKVVVSAFDELGHCVVDYVKPIEAKKKVTLAGEAKSRIFIVGSVKPKSDGEVQKFVANRIEMLVNDDSSSTFSIWISEDSGDVDALIMDSGQNTYWVTEDSVDIVTLKYDLIDIGDGDLMITTSISGSWEELDDTVNLQLETSEDEKNLFLLGLNGEVIKIDLNDENLMDKLEKHGIKANIIKDEDGDVIRLELFEKPIDEKDHGLLRNEKHDNNDLLKKDTSALPQGYNLEQNHPNPFNPKTVISYNLPRIQHVSLDIFNVQGQRVRTLVDEVQTSGRHDVEWDATNDAGDDVASGIYIYRFASGNVIAKKKMTFLK